MGEAARQWGEYTSAPVQESVVLPVDQLAHERWSQHRFQRWMGGIVMPQAVEVPPVGDIANDSSPAEAPAPSTVAEVSLRERLQRTEQGDPEAQKSSRTNIHTTVIETIFKAGHITRTSSEIAQDGSWGQYGQSYDSIYRNSLERGRQPPRMLRRTKIEALNMHRMVDCARAGLLEDNHFVVFSLVHDDQPAEIIKEDNFFTPTLSLSIQATSTEQGQVETQTAFLAGMQPFDEDPFKPASENLAGLNAAMTNRFDISTVRNMYKQWGIAHAEDMSVIDLLSTPLLVPKDTMPHGVSSLARQYDQILGRDTFFGTSNESHDYGTFADYCATREQQYASITDDVLHDLLQEVESFADDFQANQRMQDLVDQYTNRRATKDTSIDARNFGALSAVSIEQARVSFARGDMYAYFMHASHALATSVTTACGIKSSAKGGSGDSIFDSLRSLLDPQDKSDAEKEYAGPEKDSVMKCVKCPLCKKDGVDANIKIHRAERKKVITCSSCRQSKQYDLAG